MKSVETEMEKCSNPPLTDPWAQIVLSSYIQLTVIDWPDSAHMSMSVVVQALYSLPDPSQPLSY